METLLVHQTIARTFLPRLMEKLQAAKVEVRGCPRTCQLLPDAKPAVDDDFGKEFLELVLAVKVVKNMDEAMEHIAKYGSQHTEAIITTNYQRAMRFLREVDAGAVLVNASTRLNDGYQFGLGAEIPASARPASMPGVQWGWKSSPVRSISSWGAARSASKWLATLFVPH